MARKVIWSIGASLDKDEILKYWLLRNRTYSYPRKLNKLFHQTLKLLSKNPELGRKTSVPGIRSRLVRDYCCFTSTQTKLLKC